MTRPLTRSSRRGHLLLLLAVAGLALFPSVVSATVPPAGEVITSRSLVTYEMNGVRYSAFSNEISFSVLSAYGPSVTPDGTPDLPAELARAFSGETVSFAFRLKNSGNADDVFSLSLAYPSPSDFIPAGAAVFLGVARDSIVEMGRLAVSAVGPLRPGEEVPLLIAASVPQGLAGGEIAHIDLVACSQADRTSCDRGNVVRIEVRREAQVPLTLAANATSVLPGDTIRFTIHFTNDGERAATGVALADYIDFNGLCEGADYVPGSASSSVPGSMEYFDAASSGWSGIAPPVARIRGIRLLLTGLGPGAGGDLSFRVRVRAGRAEGDLRNVAVSDFTGGDVRPYHLESNAAVVRVGRVSSVAIGPRGNPAAVAGSPDDRVVTRLNGSDASYTLWHEILNQGNFADSFRVALVDSVTIPDEWRIDFVDSAGSPLNGDSGYRAVLGAVPRGRSSIVGLRLRSTPEGFRRFAGRELRFDVEASSLFFEQSNDRVEDVLIKADIPIISITQSMREPSALVGDIVSFIVAVENVTGETVLDSVAVIENLCPGLGYAEGSITPRISGNTITWNVGRLEPGEKREIVFRARVKAGQETGRLVSSAWARGVTETGERASDGPAQAAVLIVEGIFTRRGIILGGVFVDADSSGVWDAGEIGVFGVSVFIEDGTFAVADSLGLYSIPGVIEGRHVVRIDPASLPDSLAPRSAGYFGLGEAGEVLIDLAPSGHRRVDFPLARVSSDSSGTIGPAASSGSAPSPGPAGSPGSAASRGRAASSDLAASRDPAASPGPALESNEPQGSEPRTPQQAFEAITIQSTHFAAGQAEIEGIPLSQVAALSLWIRDNPGWKVFIEGHTDSIPMRSAAFPSNLELSIARARSVFQILRMNAIPEDRMDYTGVGARMPVASNATEEGRALNRRVEIRVVPPENYTAGDPGLPRMLSESEQADYSLADSAGICADIIKPEEGQIYFSRGEIDVELVSPLGSDVELYVNNLPVGKERIGLKKIDIAGGTFGSIFYGVKIAEGRNDILVVCREYGGKRSTCVRHVYLAGLPQLIVPEHETITTPADGKTVPEIVFLVSDRNGLPVRDGIFVTVSGPRDLVEALDANPQQAGVQAATLNGRVVLRLPPSRESRRETVRVSLGGFGAGGRIVYEASLRPWFLLGYGEGALGYSKRTGSGSTLRSLEPQRDGAFAEGTLAFYGQGEVRSGHLLTCAVNTRPLHDDMLFRRIEPDKYYPMYGDASELKFNTASRSGTYLRFDHRRYEAMLGDFKTDLGKAEFAKYDRSFNGVSAVARFARTAVRGFITRTDQVTYQEEMRAEGTSGFYFLKHYPLVEHGENIRIEVRDRYHSERIVRVDYKQANRDYDINYMDGSILFKEPVPAFDESLNPVTIVVSYECRNSGEQNFIYGMRTSIAVRDSLEFGTTAVLEEEGVENSTLLGIDLMGQVREGLRVESEFAHSEKFLLGGGNAFRVLLRGEVERVLIWSAYYRDVGESFFNPSFSGGKMELGSRKLGGDLAWRISRAFGVSTKGHRHAFRERDETKDYVDIVGHYTAGALGGSIGFAGAGHSDTREGDQSALLMLTGLTLKGARTQGEVQWDQVLSGEEVEEYPNRIQAKLSRRLWRNVSGTIKHEYRTGSRTGTRHLTQLGLESSITQNMTAYSRYQLEGAMGGERGQATMGIKNRFVLSEDLAATVAAEKLATFSGMRNEDYFSLSTGALYTPQRGDYRMKGNYEIRLEPERRKHLAELAGLKRLGEQWALLIKGDIWLSDEKLEEDHVKGSSTIGFSLRPSGRQALTILSLVKSQYERNSPAHPGAVDRELLSSIEANYRMSRDWELEGKLAARWVTNAFREYSADAAAFMYQAQVVRIIAKKWDAGLKGRLVYQRETGTMSHGGGVEIGRLAADNLWVGAGYDFGGHDDKDAAINSFTRNGFHVGMRLKFNEKIMSYFYGDRRADE